MAHKKVRHASSGRGAERDEEVRPRVYSALDGLGMGGSHFRVSVGGGVVSVWGEVKTAFDLASLADSLRSIPRVKQVNARVKVVSDRDVS